METTTTTNAGPKPALSLEMLGRSQNSPLSTSAGRSEHSNAESRNLLSRLTQALDENAALSRKYEESLAEFDRHRDELNAEIEKLNARLSGRLKSLLEPREKLMREEYERRFQDLTVDLRSERGKYSRELKALKERMGLCICGSLRR